jgi:Flp pilus assembly protein TadD
VAAAIGIFAFQFFLRQPEMWYQRGMSALARGDLKTLEGAARKLHARCPGSPRANLLMGAHALRGGDPVRALELLNAAARDPQTQWPAQFLAGEAFCELHQFQMAIRTLQPALEHSPDNIDGHRWLAVACFDIGAVGQAIEHLTRVAELAPADPRPQRMMGFIYADAENYKEAVLAYELSLRRSRDYPGINEVLAELAAAQVKLHRYADALLTLADAESTPDIDVLRAEALYGLGRAAESRKIIEALPENDQDHRALVLRGTLWLDDGQPKLAIRCLRKAVSLRPDEFEAHFKLAQALAEAGEADQAKVELAEVERIKAIRYEIADLLEQAPRAPEDADLRFRLGVLCEKLPRPDLARKWYRAALGLDPQHEPARQALRETAP